MQDIKGEFHILNGELRPIIEFDDSFLLETKYIYEIFRAINGKPLFIEDHLERFEQSLLLSNLAMPYDKSEILWQIEMLIRENNLKNGNIKMVFLDDEDTTGHRFFIYINPHEYPTEDQYMLGVPVSFYHKTRMWPNVKLMDTLMRAETEKLKIRKKVYELLLIDEEGYITEGSRSNVFFIKDDEVITPPVDCILPGVTRKHIINLCKEASISIKEKKVHKDSIEEMEGVFLSGTSRKVLPVNKINNYSFKVIHPLIVEIKEGFNNKVEEYLAS